MELTASYEVAVPATVRARFDFRETRNAAQLLRAIHPDLFDEVIGVLGGFRLTSEDVTGAGGSKSTVARRLDRAFRELGWREGRHDTHITSVLRIQPWRAAGETVEETRQTEVLSEGYKVDNVKGRFALDVEWNAKDGNLDRDLGAYRALYDAGIIDGGMLVVRDFDSIRDLACSLGADKFGTTTTTTVQKLQPRLLRGAGGGCPILAAVITARCFDPSAAPGRRPGRPDGQLPL